MARSYRRLSGDEVRALWTRWQGGASLLEIAEGLGTEKGRVWWVVQRRGGLGPPVRTRAARVLQLSDREEISRGLAQGESLRSVARRLGRAPSTISREIRRHGGTTEYRASVADAAAWQRAGRPKPRRVATSPRLRRVVAARLRQDWSPEQIARWLGMTYPDEPAMHVSHETIYRTLYVQARGALKRALVAHLRHGQRYRRPRAAAHATRGPGQIVGAVSIAARPPSADTRAVPGQKATC